MSRRMNARRVMTMRRNIVILRKNEDGGCEKIRDECEVFIEGGRNVAVRGKEKGVTFHYS
jgi:hypothetical protein